MSEIKREFMYHLPELHNDWKSTMYRIYKGDGTNEIRLITVFDNGREMLSSVVAIEALLPAGCVVVTGNAGNKS